MISMTPLLARIRTTARRAVSLEILLLFGALQPVSARAQDGSGPRADTDGPIVTDRPDFTESADVVSPGRLQLEAGYTFTYDHESELSSYSHGAPELLLRVGLIDGLEFRLGWEGYIFLKEDVIEQTRRGRTTVHQNAAQGSSDLYLGLKQRIWPQEGLRPDFSLIPAITVPSGTIGFSSGDVDPEIKLAWAYELSERIGLSGNVNLAVPTDESGRFFQSAASISLSVSLTEKLGSYVEYYGFYPNTRSTDCSHTLNGGLTYKLSDDLQLDWRIGLGLNEEADDFFTGAGFAIRL